MKSELTTFKRSGKWIPPERTFSFNKKEDDKIEGGFNSGTLFRNMPFNFVKIKMLLYFMRFGLVK